MAVNKGPALAVMSGLRAALRADPDLTALISGRVVDEPRKNQAFPYVRFGRIDVKSDDTSGHIAYSVTIGLEAHSRPIAGRVEATAICEAMSELLHRKPEAVTLAGFNLWDLQAQAMSATPASDGASYVGVLALRLKFDAA